MLPSELLLSSRCGPRLYPKFLRPEQHIRADEVLSILAAHRDRTRGELIAALRALEGDSPDYRIVRGLAHLAMAAAQFALPLPDLEPELLRRQVFSRAAEYGHGEEQTLRVLTEIGAHYGLDSETLREALYADLPENHALMALPDFTPDSLVDRYNLAQAQGLLYSAMFMRLTAHRNEPGEYRRLFRHLKFFGLMYAVEGCLEDGYRIHVDGPASLFRQTRKYGIQMALFLPALLHVSRWELEASLKVQNREVGYTLNSSAPLRSHYARSPVYDSLLESRFAERWVKQKTPWVLEREVEIVDLKGTVFVPDFALRHSDGRVMHVEIVGFWHPDYLRRKLDKVRRAGMENLILAVSERLNVGGEALEGISGPIVFFKGKLEPRTVLKVLEEAHLA